MIPFCLRLGTSPTTALPISHFHYSDEVLNSPFTSSTSAQARYKERSLLFPSSVESLKINPESTQDTIESLGIFPIFPMNFMAYCPSTSGKFSVRFFANLFPSVTFPQEILKLPKSSSLSCRRLEILQHHTVDFLHPHPPTLPAHSISHSTTH